jgi:hypothetical protein
LALPGEFDTLADMRFWAVTLLSCGSPDCPGRPAIRLDGLA